MLKYENINISISKRKIIHDASLSFPYGTITSILGPNGCGKSTLFRGLVYNHMIDSGQITLDNKPLFSYTLLQRAKRIAFLPQMKEIPNITVRSLILQGRFPYHGVFQKESSLDHYFLMQSMKDTNITELAEKSLLQLSGGEIQRAYLAMILAQNTDYIILDEPTTYLDIRHRLEFLEILKVLRNRGKTIITILHDINEALDISDVVVLMNNGQITKTLTNNEFLNSDIIKEAFHINFDFIKKKEKTFTSFTISQ